MLLKLTLVNITPWLSGEIRLKLKSTTFEILLVKGKRIVKSKVILVFRYEGLGFRLCNQIKQ